MTTRDREDGAAAKIGAAQSAGAAADTLSQRGALALAKRLQNYWHARGYKQVRFWTEPLTERCSKVGTYELYRVVCNLVGGVPPRYRG
jgi:hypothetical protein